MTSNSSKYRRRTSGWVQSVAELGPGLPGHQRDSLMIIHNNNNNYIVVNDIHTVVNDIHTVVNDSLIAYSLLLINSPAH